MYGVWLNRKHHVKHIEHTHKLSLGICQDCSTIRHLVRVVFQGSIQSVPIKQNRFKQMPRKCRRLEEYLEIMKCAFLLFPKVKLIPHFYS